MPECRGSFPQLVLRVTQPLEGCGTYSEVKAIWGIYTLWSQHSVASASPSRIPARSNMGNNKHDEAAPPELYVAPAGIQARDFLIPLSEPPRPTRDTSITAKGRIEITPWPTALSPVHFVLGNFSLRCYRSPRSSSSSSLPWLGSPSFGTRGR